MQIRSTSRRVLQRLVAMTLAFIAAPAVAQDLTVTTPPPTEPTLIINAIVHIGTGDVIDPGHILIGEDGRILSVGRMDDDAMSLMPKANLIDAAGLHAYPALIDACTNLGLREIFAVRASEDRREVGSLKPEVKASTTINPDSTLLPVARTNGILYAGVLPEGGVIQGQAAFIGLDGWTVEDLTIQPRAGLVVSWPQMRPINAWWMDQSESEQRKRIRENLDTLDEFFAAAVAYDAMRTADSNEPVDMRFEALRAYLPSAGEDQLPLMIRAQDLDQITAAISWCDRTDLRCIIVGGRDAPLVAHMLNTHEVPVIITGTQTFPKRADSPYDHAYTLPQRLEEAGVLWCFATAEEPSNVRNLPYHAGISVAHGLDADAAIRGMTLNAARIYGLESDLGTIEEGKLGSIIIADGNILEVRTNVLRAMLAGREIDLTNKQTVLRDKYREKYRQLGIIEDE